MMVCDDDDYERKKSEATDKQVGKAQAKREHNQRGNTDNAEQRRKAGKRRNSSQTKH